MEIAQSQACNLMTARAQKKSRKKMDCRNPGVGKEMGFVARILTGGGPLSQSQPEYGVLHDMVAKDDLFSITFLDPQRLVL